MGQRQQQGITFTRAVYAPAAAWLMRMNYVYGEHQATDAAEKDSASLPSHEHDRSQLSFAETGRPASRAIRLENALFGAGYYPSGIRSDILRMQRPQRAAGAEPAGGGCLQSAPPPGQRASRALPAAGGNPSPCGRPRVVGAGVARSQDGRQPRPEKRDELCGRRTSGDRRCRETLGIPPSSKKLHLMGQYTPLRVLG